MFDFYKKKLIILRPSIFQVDSPSCISVDLSGSLYPNVLIFILKVLTTAKNVSERRYGTLLNQKVKVCGHIRVKTLD